MAALSVPPPGEGGSELQHEGDWQLQGALGPADHGKSTDIQVHRASFDEQKKRNGRPEGGENQIPEMGDRLDGHTGGGGVFLE